MKQVLWFHNYIVSTLKTNLTLIIQHEVLNYQVMWVINLGILC